MTAPKVFISYRRSDAGGYAGRLYDVLTRAGFEVFVDVDKIGIGGDFVEIIKRSVSSTDALLALIGPEWLTATKADGTRRLDDPRDFVRLEVAAGLSRGITVIPVLVEDAKPPHADDLPTDLKLLARRNAHEISDTRWDYDTGRLIKRLCQLTDGDGTGANGDGGGNGKGRRRIGTEPEHRWLKRSVIATSVIAIIGLAVTLLFNGPTKSEAIPLVATLTAEEAEAQLIAKGFVVEKRLVEDKNVPEGDAIGTDPGGGAKVARGARISLLVSLGFKISIPNVAGMPEAKARDRLEDLGFDVHDKHEASATVPEGKAIGTSPPAGRRLAEGERVDLRISTGPPFKADVAVKITADRTDVAVGDTVTFTLEIKNLGPDAATTVRAKSRWSGVTATLLGVAPPGCTLVENNQIACSFDRIEPAASRVVSFQIQVTSPGALENNSTATRAESDAKDWNDSDSISVNVA